MFKLLSLKYNVNYIENIFYFINDLLYTIERIIYLYLSIFFLKRKCIIYLKSEKSCVKFLELHNLLF